MTIALVANVAKQGTGSGTGNSSAIDTSGANFIAIGVASVSSLSPADSKGNTWTARGNAGGAPILEIYDAQNATVGTGHTFSATGINQFPGIAAAAFSGVLASGAFDQANNATTIGSSIATGSVTPSEDNELLFFVTGREWTSIVSVSVGTQLDTLALIGGSAFAIGSAYQIQTTATARNPLFTFGGTAAVLANIATYKAAAAAASGLGALLSDFRARIVGGGLVAA